MEKAEIKKLIGNGLSENFALLHGTGIGSVIELSESGKLPTGNYHPEENRQHKDFGHLYFTPVTRNLKNHSADLPYVSKAECLRETKRYAKATAFSQHLASELGCTTAQQYYTIYGYALDLSSVDRHYKGDPKDPMRRFQQDLKSVGIDVSPLILKQMQKNAKKTRGVLIEADKSIMELPYSVDFAGEAISFHCPSGLEKKYIKGIELLGSVENKMMDSFLSGSLNYKEFRADAPQTV